MYITKAQFEVVEYVTKSTSRFLKDWMSIPGDSSYYRLLTTDHEINLDRCVQMFESIYRYSVINQKGKDEPFYEKSFVLLVRVPCKRVFTILN